MFSATRLADHKLAMKQDISRWQVGPLHSLEHHHQCHIANLARRLTQRGERDRQQWGIIRIVDSHETDIVRNAITQT